MPEPKLCLDCGEEMVLRESRDGDQFWGCSGFPECRYTEPVDEEDDGWGEREQPLNSNL